MFKKLKSYRSLIILLCSIILGSILGLIFGEKITFIKPLGDIFLNLMFTLVVPLIFFTVTSAIASMSNLNRLGKILKYVFIIFIITSLVAAITMFITLKIVNPVSGDITLSESVVETLSVGDQIVKAVTVPDFYGLLSKSNVLPLIIFSILFGISLSLIGDGAEPVITKLNTLSKVMMKMVNLVMYYAPIGLCAYFASLVGEYGPSIIGSYAKGIIIYYILAIVYFVVFYSIYAYIAGGKDGLKNFWRHIVPSMITSLATQSSLATLPVNMETTDYMNIPKDVSKVTLSLGSTMHMEGSSMGAILKIMFVFALLGRPFTGVGNYLIAMLIAVLSAVVMAGVPGGGLIGETLIVSLYGLPSSAFAVIATIGILIDPPATMLNATGDIASSMLVTKLIDKKM
ncbi:MAG: dicarboxylate/amino acid:cation symporter [Bacilli bacterium]|nr:dicarboxylate/amino acid:cation symporter [Bacilli bacterium]